MREYIDYIPCTPRVQNTDRCVWYILVQSLSRAVRVVDAAMGSPCPTRCGLASAFFPDETHVNRNPETIQISLIVSATLSRHEVIGSAAIRYSPAKSTRGDRTNAVCSAVIRLCTSGYVW